MRRTTAFLILLGLCASLLVSASCVKRRSDLSDMCVKVYPETGEPSSPFDQTLTRINISTQYAVGAVYNLEFVDETGAEVHDSNYMQGEIRFQQSEHLYQNVLFDVKTGKWSPRLSSRLRRGAQPVEGMHGQVLGTLAPSGAIRWHASSLVFLKDLALLSNTAFREMRFMQPLSLELRDIWDENWQGIVTYLPLGVEHFDGQRAVRVSVSSLGYSANRNGPTSAEINGPT